MKNLTDILDLSTENFLVLLASKKHRIPKMLDPKTKDNLLHIVLSKDIKTIDSIFSDSKKRFKAVITKEMIAAKNNSDLTPLHLATKRGHAEATKFLLEMKANPNAQTNDGTSPLMIAAGFGYHVLIQTLLKENANPYLVSSFGDIALHIAAKSNHLLALNFLLSKAPQTINMKSNSLTPLHLSAMNDDKGGVVKFLIEKKAEVNVSAEHGITPFMSAAVFNRVAAAKSLWESKADPYIFGGDLKDSSAMGLAISCGHIEFLQFLITSKILAPDIISNLAPKEGLPLRMAIGKEQIAMLEFLLKVNPDMINWQDDEFSLTALHYAMQTDIENPAITRVLLNHGANPNIQNCDGNTPLMQACDLAREQLVDLMLTESQIKCDLSICNDTGLTAFYWAARRGNIPIGKRLLEAGDVSAGKFAIEKPLQTRSTPLKETKNPVKPIPKGKKPEKLPSCFDHFLELKDADTPFHAAVKNDHVEFVRLLLERKAVEPDLVNKAGETALWTTLKEGGDEAMALCLIHYKADINYAYKDIMLLHLAVLLKRISLLSKILDEKNIKIDVCSELLSTPLCLAAAIGGEEAVRLLIVKKADLYMGFKDATPLFWATLRGRHGVVKLLLDAKADPTKVCTTDKIIPLRAVLEKIIFSNEAIESNYWEILRYLIRFSPEAPLTSDHETALHISVYFNKPLLVQNLLECSVNVNAQTTLEKETPLHIAAKLGHEDLVRLLIQFKANLNLQLSSYDATPLHIAVLNNSIKIVALLVENKADLNIRTNDGWTALMVAHEDKHTAVEKLLFSAGSANLEKSENKKEPKKKIKTQGEPYKRKKQLADKNFFIPPEGEKFDFGEFWKYGGVKSDDQKIGIRRLTNDKFNTNWFITVTDEALSKIMSADQKISDAVLQNLREPRLVQHGNGHQKTGFVRGNERLKEKNIYLKLTLSKLSELRLFSTRIVENQGKILFILDHFEKLHGRTTGGKFRLTQNRLSFVSNMTSIAEHLGIQPHKTLLL